MELLLTNRTLKASEALQLGLVAEVAVDPVARAREVAATFAVVPPETLLTTRKLLDPPLNAQLLLEQEAVAAAAKRPEFRRALDAFLRR